MLNHQEGPFGFEPLPGANAQERQQAAREPWRLQEEQARDADERQRQQDEWARQERESRLAERLASIAQRDRDEYRTPTAAGSLFEFLRHHWAVFRAQTSGTARPGTRSR
jgi:hypothetical protein